MDNFSPVFARTGADIDEPVGCANRLFVVFNHDEGVPEVSKSNQGVNETAIVPLMKPNTGFVEDV